MIDCFVGRETVLHLAGYETICSGLLVQTRQDDLKVLDSVVEGTIDGFLGLIVNTCCLLSRHEVTRFLEKWNLSSYDLHWYIDLGILVALTLVSFMVKAVDIFLVICSSWGGWELLFYFLGQSKHLLLVNLFILLSQFVHFFSKHLIENCRHFSFEIFSKLWNFLRNCNDLCQTVQCSDFNFSLWVVWVDNNAVKQLLEIIVDLLFGSLLENIQNQSQCLIS